MCVPSNDNITEDLGCCLRIVPTFLGLVFYNAVCEINKALC